jgi:hypothetical protein
MYLKMYKNNHKDNYVKYTWLLKNVKIYDIIWNSKLDDMFPLII